MEGIDNLVPKNETQTPFEYLKDDLEELFPG